MDQWLDIAAEPKTWMFIWNGISNLLLVASNSAIIIMEEVGHLFPHQAMNMGLNTETQSKTK